MPRSCAWFSPSDNRVNSQTTDSLKDSLCRRSRIGRGVGEIESTPVASWEGAFRSDDFDFGLILDLLFACLVSARLVGSSLRRAEPVCGSAWVLPRVLATASTTDWSVCRPR